MGQNKIKIWLIRIILLAVLFIPMILWPKVFIVFFAALLAVGFLLLFWLKRKLRKFIEPFEELAENLTTETLHLIPCEKPAFFKAESVLAIHSHLEEQGFHRAGSFTAKEIPDTYLHFLSDPANAIIALVMDLEYMDVIVEYLTLYEDSSTFTYSNTNIPEIFEKPPHHILRRFPGMDYIELLADFKQTRPDKPKQTLPDEQIPALTEALFKEEKIWQKNQFKQQEELETNLKESFLTKIGWNAVEWNRKQHDVIFVHEKLKPREVVHLFMHQTDDEDEQYDQIRKKSEKIAEQHPPLQAFEVMIQAYGSEYFTKIFSLDNPVPADVYLMRE